MERVRTRITFKFGFGLGHALHQLRGVVFTVRMRITKIVPNNIIPVGINITFPVKFGVFRREFLRNHSMNWTQIFRENLNCYALSIFRVFMLLASSDSDKHMLMRQKV